jgi:excisionase family DNA binding protein
VYQEPLISISEASHALGVNEATLRQWTDEGKIKAFITPGGHRRYSTADLKNLMASPTKTHGIKDLVTELEDTTQIHRDIARSFLKNTSWYDNLDAAYQLRLAELGRNLLGLIIRYISEPPKREDTLRLVREVGGGFGGTLAEVGLPLTDSVEAFMLHRKPIMQATTYLIRKKENVNGRIVDAIPLAAQVMDEALLSLVSAHQHYRGDMSPKDGK